MPRKLKHRNLWEARRTINGQRRSFYSETPEGAEQKATEAEVIESSWKLSRVPTLREFATAGYFPTVKDRSLKWREQIWWALDTHIYSVFANRPVDSISRIELQNFLNLKRKSLGTESVKHLRKVLYAIFDLAEADDIIKKNPARKLVVIEDRTPKAKPYQLNLEEAMTAVANAPNKFVANGIYIAATLGLSEREVVGLLWSDIKDGLVSVNKQDKNKEGDEALKTASRHRVIPVGETWLEGLVKHSHKKVCGGYKANSILGRRDVPKKPATGLKAALKHAGLPDVTFHSLRHTCPSELALLGMNLDLRRFVMGHAGTTITEHYTSAPLELIRKYMNEYHEKAVCLLNEAVQRGVQEHKELA